MNDVTREQADQENQRWLRDYQVADLLAGHVAFKEALHAKEEAESIAREKRDSYVAATLGQGGPGPQPTDEQIQAIRYQYPKASEGEARYAATELLKQEGAYFYQRMVVAALAYADAANKAALAVEHYEELVVDEEARTHP